MKETLKWGLQKWFEKVNDWRLIVLLICALVVLDHRPDPPPEPKPAITIVGCQETFYAYFAYEGGERVLQFCTWLIENR
jgi:hypothetical protein